MILKALSSLVFVLLLELTVAQLPTPHGLYYLGVGYNIITGNPEGGDLNNGGIDPGPLVTRRIFQVLKLWTCCKDKIDSRYLERSILRVIFLINSFITQKLKFALSVPAISQDPSTRIRVFLNQ